MRLALPLLLLLTLTGCPRGNSVTVGPDTYLPASTERYSVNRVSLGSNIAAVRSALGAPKRELPRGCEFDPAPFVSYRDDGFVWDVQGSALLRGDDVLVSSGMSEAQVVAALGAGWVEEQYRPTQAGGGMITTGSEFVGKEYRYKDDAGTFYLWIREGQVQGVRASVVWPKNHREPPRPR